MLNIRFLAGGPEIFGALFKIKINLVLIIKTNTVKTIEQEKKKNNLNIMYLQNTVQ